jgi:hypothetical protein
MGSKVLCTLSSPLCCMIRAEERNPVNEIQNPDEIQIDTKLFKSWRKKSGYRYLGKTYTNSMAEEKHWTPIEVAQQWGVSSDLIRSLFRDEPGVLKIDRPGNRAKRAYATLRIPDSVLVRVHTRMTSRATVLK